MLNNLKEKLTGVYTKDHLQELEQIERLLQFKHFTSNESFELGSSIVKEAIKSYDDLIVMIIREEDQLVIFQYVGEKMTQRNIDFAMKKRNTVLKSGHCSLWPLVKELVDGGQTEIFEKDADCLPVGGAFPIYVNDTMIATIAISGLHDGKDFTVFMQALAAYHKINVPQFHGKCI